jgi:uncharacterized membrane protein YfcA
VLPPIGLLAALRYYKAGFVNFKVAGFLATAFFLGASIGALGATRMNAELLRRIFGGVLFAVSLHMIFGRHGK